MSTSACNFSYKYQFVKFFTLFGTIEFCNSILYCFNSWIEIVLIRRQVFQYTTYIYLSFVVLCCFWRSACNEWNICRNWNTIFSYVAAKTAAKYILTRLFRKSHFYSFPQCFHRLVVEIIREDKLLANLMLNVCINVLSFKQL